MKSRYVILMISLIFLCACSTERDPGDPRLRPYQESGSNIGSALFNYDVWNLYCRGGATGLGGYTECQSLIIQYDSLKQESMIELTGKLSENGTHVRIRFILTNSLIRNYEDLKALEGTVVNLDGTEGVADLCFSSNHCQTSLDCDKGEVSSYGRLYLRNVAQKFEDGRLAYHVLSGTFGFDLTSPCWTYNVYKGRFDNELKFFRSAN